MSQRVLRFSRALLCVLALLYGECVLPSQVVSPPAEVTGNPEVFDGARQYVIPADYRIGPEDVLSITLYDMPELSRRAAVDSKGELRLGYVKSPIVAAGRTASELSQLIEMRLRADQIAVDPQVSVSVYEVRSHPITVSGSVRHPGVLQAERPLTLLEALLRAGGPDETAGRHVLVTSTTARQALTTRDLPLSRVLLGTDARYNFVLKTGDYVRVLPGGQVFVAGAVEQPGAFPIKAEEPLTAVRALSMAHGCKPEAQLDKAVIARLSSAGAGQRIPVHLSRILVHREPDIALQENDVLYVPESGGKNTGLFLAKGIAQSAFWALAYLAIK